MAPRHGAATVRYAMRRAIALASPDDLPLASRHAAHPRRVGPDLRGGRRSHPPDRRATRSGGANVLRRTPLDRVRGALRREGRLPGDGRTAAAYGAGMRWAEVLIPAVQTPARAGANVAALVAAAWVWLLDFEHVAAAREEHARAAASELTGERDVETALARVAICESYVDEVFWPALVARHSANVEAPDAITQLRNAVHARMPDDEWQRRWNRARAELKLATIDPPTQDMGTPRASALVDAAPVFTRAF